MTIQITGRNIDLGEAFRTYALERTEQVLGKYVDGALSGHITVQKEGGDFATNCAIALPSGLTLQSHGEAGDAYASAEAALERLEKRVRRYKRKLKNHHQKLREPLGATTATDYVVDAGDEDQAEATDSPNPLIIAETRTAVHDLTVSEAVMRLDLTDALVLVFRNAANGGINVVYRRKDGNIGWISPESA